MNSLKPIDRKFTPGEYVCIQGQKQEYFYVLLEGELEILLTDEFFLKDGQTESVLIESVNSFGKIIGLMDQPWTHFGEMGHLLNSNANSSIRAKVHSVIRCIPANREPFNHYITKNPALGFRIAINLGCQIYQSLISIQKIQRTIDSTHTYLNQLEASCKNSLLQILASLERIGENNLEPIRSLLSEKIIQGMPIPEPSYDALKTLVIKPKKPLEPTDSIFNTSKTVRKNPGEILKLQTDDNDFIYILKKGEIGIFQDGNCRQLSSQTGDIFGGVQTFSSLGKSIRHLQYVSCELRPMITSELIYLSNSDIRDEVQDHPELILYINYAFAEVLEDIGQELKGLWKFEDHFLKLLSRDNGSWQEFIKSSLAVFNDNQTWFLECMEDVLNLKRALNATETNYLKFSQDSRSNYMNPILTGNKPLI